MRLPITCKDLESIPDKPECCQICHDNSVSSTAFWDVCCNVDEWLQRENVNIYSNLMDPANRIVKGIKQDG